MNRRGFMGSILAAGVAPYVSTMSGVLMPVRQIARIRDDIQAGTFIPNLSMFGGDSAVYFQTVNTTKTFGRYVRAGELVSVSFQVGSVVGAGNLPASSFEAALKRDYPSYAGISLPFNYATLP